MDDKLMFLEMTRKKAATRLTFIMIVSGLPALLIFLASIKSLFLASFMISFLSWIALVFLLYYITGCNRLYNKFRESFKKILVEEPFCDAFGEIDYQINTGFDKDIIKDTEMMQMGNRYYSNDYIHGHYKDVGFKRADVKIQQHTSNGKSSSTVTYFNGRWLIFDFNKDFHFDLQLIGDGFNYSHKNKSFFTSSEERRHKVEMEDINFNQCFTVYAQDDHEAYYLLTPQFMEVLKSMYGTMDGSIMLGFVNNQLHVAINTKRDAMEPSLFKSIGNYSMSHEVQQEINVITNLIDGLKLDRNLY